MAGKTKVKELTPEEKMAKEREHGLSMLERCIPFLSEPSYRFDVGDFVSYGSMKSAMINEVLHDGKAYGLKCIATAQNYGNPYDYETYAVAPWMDVRPREIGTTEFTSNRDVRIFFNNSTIESVLHKYYHFGVDTDPEYQRDYVWEDSDRELLLDSIFANIDIGKIVFIKKEREERVDGKMYEVLDGKQRLITLIMFYENRIPYKGVFYNELSPRDRRTFDNHVVAEAEVDWADRKTILRYFLMLNRAGKVMDNEHLEKVSTMMEGLECQQ